MRGDALLFYSLKPNGEEDPTSMHGSCPTLKVSLFFHGHCNKFSQSRRCASPCCYDSRTLSARKC